MWPPSFRLSLSNWFLVVVTIQLCQVSGLAQDVPITSRDDQIQALRMAKATSAAGNGQGNTFAGGLEKLTKQLRRLRLQFQVEGLGPGAGPSLRSDIEGQTTDGDVVSRIWGKIAVHNFYSAGAGLEFPNISDKHVSLFLNGWHADAPQLEYYGSGPDSSVHDQTSFRREDTVFELRGEARFGRNVLQACRLAELLLNVGPGTNSTIPSADTVFSPQGAPGIDIQSNYLIAGCSLDLDVRDHPGDPNSGTFATVRYDRYFAQDVRRFSFHRLSGGVEQYFPFLNNKRVIALRANTELSLHSDNEVVPFYLQSTLGSDLDLRGFRRDRFFGENSINFTAEYTWEIGAGMDLALFGDAGKVFQKPEQISLRHLESSAGLGLRFALRRNVIGRVDTGISREGVQVWVRFSSSSL